MAHDRPSVERVLLRPAGFAALADIGRTSIYELIARGDIRAVRIGRILRIPATEVSRFVKIAEHNKADE